MSLVSSEEGSSSEGGGRGKEKEKDKDRERDGEMDPGQSVEPPSDFGDDERRDHRLLPQSTTGHSKPKRPSHLSSVTYVPDSPSGTSLSPSSSLASTASSSSFPTTTQPSQSALTFQQPAAQSPAQSSAKEKYRKPKDKYLE